MNQPRLIRNGQTIATSPAQIPADQQGPFNIQTVPMWVWIAGGAVLASYLLGRSRR